MTSRTAIRHLTALGGVVAVLQASAAEAAVLWVELVPELQEVDVPMAVGDALTFNLPEPITDWVMGNGHDYRLKYDPKRRDTSISFEVSQDAPPTNINIETANYYVTARLRRALPGTTPIRRVIFCEVGTCPEKALQAASVTIIQPKPDEIPVSRAEPENDFLAQRAREKSMTAPRRLTWRKGSHRLVTLIGPAGWGDAHMSFRFEAHNRGDYPYPIAGMQIRDLAGNVYNIEYHLQGGIHLDQDEPYMLEPQGSLVGAIAVSRPSALRNGWVLGLLSTPAVPSAAFRWDSAPPPRSSLQQRLLVAAHFSGGAANVDDGIGIARTAWTSTQTIGGRVLYGTAKHVSLEAALDITRTSDAVFSDATWDQTEGDLTARETAGRLLLGGLLHTAGKQWLPFARVALGARFAQHSVVMAGRTDSDLRSAAVISVGGGLNATVGQRFMAGASFAYTVAIGGSDTAETVEAGLYVGAVWDFADEW